LVRAHGTECRVRFHGHPTWFELVQRWIDAVNATDIDAAMNLYASDIVSFSYSRDSALDEGSHDG